MALNEGDAAPPVGERVGRTADNVIALADHPILLLLTLTLGVIAISGLLYYLFIYLGWTGPASLIR